jgi:hypothetical protein
MHVASPPARLHSCPAGGWRGQSDGGGRNGEGSARPGHSGANMRLPRCGLAAPRSDTWCKLAEGLWEPAPGPSLICALLRDGPRRRMITARMERGARALLSVRSGSRLRLIVRVRLTRQDSHHPRLLRSMCALQENGEGGRIMTTKVERRVCGNRCGRTSRGLPRSLRSHAMTDER